MHKFKNGRKVFFLPLSWSFSFSSASLSTFPLLKELEKRSRPPIVAIMGHVDHGKTTLLDTLRKTSVASLEAGGITQHIGAFSVSIPRNKESFFLSDKNCKNPSLHSSHSSINQNASTNASTITFLDTPGHEAFTKIRQRGAQVTDIIVLVIDKNESIMSQTRECIELARRESVPLIIAISKCDDGDGMKGEWNQRILNSPQIRRIVNDLAQNEIYVEAFGMNGDTQIVPTSAIKGFGISHLLEAIQVQSEILELKANWNVPVDSIVIEARLKEGLGEVSTLLIKEGTLRIGNLLLSGESICRVKGMMDHRGVKVDKATPSMPVEVIGWKQMPQVGSHAIQITSEKDAHDLIEKSRIKRERKEFESTREIIKKRQEVYNHLWQIKLKRDKDLASIPRNQFTIEQSLNSPSIEQKGKNCETRNSFNPSRENNVNVNVKPVVNIILNCDVVGSLEALQQSFNQIPQGKVSLKIVSIHLGAPTDTDLNHAKALQAIVISFNLKIPKNIVKLATFLKVQIISSDIIYRLVDSLREIMISHLPKLFVNTKIGMAQVIQTFSIGNENVAGCMIMDGIVQIKVANSSLSSHFSSSSNSNLKSIDSSSSSTSSSVPTLVSIKRENGEVILENAKIKSMKHEKRDIQQATKGMECGIIIEDFNDWLPGDSILCFTRIEKIDSL